MLEAGNKKFMDVNTQKQINFHFEILPRATKKALDFLSGQKWFKKSDWYLAGGTALTLQAGQRVSVDLDFFTKLKDFSEEGLIDNFIGNKDWRTDINKKNTVYGTLFKAKVSFIAYPFFIPKQKPVFYGSIKILNPIDIAVMKVIAISQRGRKRDFFDLYWCAKNLEPLEKTIRRLKAQYPSVAHDYHHILKSLVFFEDAENDPAPEILFKADWKEVKRFFIKEIPIIAARIIDLE
jgi:predicted nucleotidyltransferase component of viral defense system